MASRWSQSINISRTTGHVGINTTNKDYPVTVGADESGRNYRAIGRESDDLSTLQFVTNDLKTILGSIQASEFHLKLVGQSGSVPIFITPGGVGINNPSAR